LAYFTNSSQAKSWRAADLSPEMTVFRRFSQLARLLQ
jgi:hypothetical protein